MHGPSVFVARRPPKGTKAVLPPRRGQHPTRQRLSGQGQMDDEQRGRRASLTEAGRLRRRRRRSVPFGVLECRDAQAARPWPAAARPPVELLVMAAERRVVCNIEQGRSVRLGRGCGDSSGRLHGLPRLPPPAPVGLRRDHHLSSSSPSPPAPDHGPARYCADSLSQWISGGERFRLGRTDGLAVFRRRWMPAKAGDVNVEHRVVPQTRKAEPQRPDRVKQQLCGRPLSGWGF